VYHWPPAYGDTTHPKKDVPFGDFITMRGGEYFFAPCLSMLQSLRVATPLATGVATKVPNVPVLTTVPKPGEPVMHSPVLASAEVLAHVDGNSIGNLLPNTNPLDSVLLLFVPETIDIGAGVVNIA
jgi:hypothetical protein